MSLNNATMMDPRNCIDLSKHSLNLPQSIIPFSDWLFVRINLISLFREVLKEDLARQKKNLTKTLAGHTKTNEEAEAVPVKMFHPSDTPETLLTFWLQVWAKISGRTDRRPSDWGHSYSLCTDDTQHNDEHHMKRTKRREKSRSRAKASSWRNS